MPIRIIDHEWLHQLPFRITREKFKYLGIIITKNFNSLFKANFDPLTDTLRNNIQFWRTLPISLLGRTNAVKMIFLLQLLYLLQNIPVCISKTFFKRLDSIILSFVWDYKVHRIGKAYLCKPKTNGGLALPNFIHYYWASNIRSVAYLLDDSAVLPVGLEMEREDCLPFSAGAVILSPVPLSKANYSNNPVIHNIIIIWKQLKKHFKLRNVSFLLPIIANPSFAPSYLDGSFLAWKDLEISCVVFWLNGLTQCFLPCLLTAVLIL